MRVLIADDGLTTRRLLTRYLTGWGYQVVSASNGHEAWKILSRPDTPRLVILDWVMPGIDGIDICRQARLLKYGEQLHIIIFTSMEANSNRLTALQAGADDYISKRFEMGELEARLRIGHRSIRLKANLAQRVEELEQALKHIKRLQGILPICMHCHRIRNEEEAWLDLEAYLAEHSDVTFSHGVCPSCAETFYSE